MIFFKRRPLQSKSEIILRNIVVAGMLAYYIVFFVVPIGMAFVGSFHNWNPLSGKFVFTGLRNYVNLFKNKIYWTSMYNTAIFCVVVSTLRTVLGFLCAYALYSKLVKFKNFFRTLLYMPVIAPMVGVTFVWKFIYNPQFGILNQILGTEMNWLNNADTALWAVIAMTVWKDFGYAVVLYMAGLFSISEELLEAASVDGCNAWQKLTNMIIPLVKPMSVFIIISSIITYLQTYVQVLVLTEGGPGTATYLASFTIYKEAFEKYSFGSASAMSFVLFLFTGTLTLLSFRVSGKNE